MGGDSQQNYEKEGCLRSRISSWYIQLGVSNTHAFLPSPALSEPYIMVLRERASDIGFFVIFIVHVWCVFLLLGAICSLKFCCDTSGPSLLSMCLSKFYREVIEKDCMNIVVS